MLPEQGIGHWAHNPLGNMERLKGPWDVGGGYLLGWLFFLGKVSSEIYDCLSAAQPGYSILERISCRMQNLWHVPRFPQFHSWWASTKLSWVSIVGKIVSKSLTEGWWSPKGLPGKTLARDFRVMLTPSLMTHISLYSFIIKYFNSMACISEVQTPLSTPVRYFIRWLSFIFCVTTSD